MNPNSIPVKPQTSKSDLVKCPFTSRNRLVKLPPISHHDKMSNYKKIYQYNGHLSYPKEFFSQRYSGDNLKQLYPQFHRTQQREIVKLDKFKNRNYLKRGDFYIRNNYYSNLNIN